jgi:3-oxoacyl-[acyl-carrier protein] reductase
MDLGLHGKRALITGGSRGIGLAIADALAAEGAAVGLIARDPSGLAAAARRLADRGTQVATAAADVTDTPALRRAVDQIATDFGGLDHLVANAGGTVGGGNLTNSRDGEFAATLALNAGHAAELIRAGLGHLRAAGGGSVVIISSITGTRPAPRTAYAAAKAADVVAFLLSERASWISGANIVVDGAQRYPSARRFD